MVYLHKTHTLILFFVCFFAMTSFAQTSTVFDTDLFTPREIEEFGVVNNQLIYLGGNGRQLKATDGNNIVDLVEFPNPCSTCGNFRDERTSAVLFNNKYYINYFDKLYVTDGTPAGTQQIYDFEQSFSGFVSSISNLDIFNGEIYFVYGGTLYRFNENSTPQPLTNSITGIFETEVVNGQLYFYRIDFDASPGWPLEYYVGDGTVGGSTLINEGPHSFTTDCSFADFYSLDGQYAFYEYAQCSSPTEFFINETQVPIEYSEFAYVVLNGNLYFAGTLNGVNGIYNYNNGNPQLSATVGSDIDDLERLDNGNIVAFADNIIYNFTPGNLTQLFSEPQVPNLNVVLNTGSEVYFTLGFQFNNTALWVTDGTTGGTQELTELDNSIGTIAALGGSLFFNQTVVTESLVQLFLDPNFNPVLSTLSTPNTTVDGTPFQVTATFSEAVSGFSLDDIAAPAFNLSNLSGGPTVYTFTAQANPAGQLSMQIINNAATSNQGVGSISSPVLTITSTIDPGTLCTTEITAGSDFIQVSKNYAERYTIQIVKDGQTVFQQSGVSSDQEFEFTINDLEPGNYYYFVTLRTQGFNTICTLDGPLVLTGTGACTDNDNDGVCAADDCNDNNASIPTTPGTACNDNNSNTINDVIQSDGCSCAGTPNNTGGGCQVTTGVSGNTILISGLPADANTKLFDSNFGVAFECNPWSGSACTGSEQVSNLAQGTYFLSVQSNDCDEWIPLVVAAAGTCELQMTVSNFSCNNAEVTYDVFVTGNNTTGNTFTTSIQAGFGSIEQQYAYNQTHTITETFTSVLQSVIITVWDTGLNTCGATVTEQCPNQGGCNVAVNSTAGLIEVTGLPSDANAKLFDNSFASVFECNPWNGNLCQGLEQITGLVNGATYYLSVQSNDCDEWIPVVYQAGGGCTDLDGDGVCVADDCDDNNANLPASPGTICNDGNSNTINDIIQNDGCTCQGTPNNPNSCQLTALDSNGNIALSGLTADLNLKVFDANYGVVFQCNPWSGSPCSGTQVVTGLTQGATYFVSAVGDVCDEWIPITVSGASTPQPDLTVSNLQIPGSAPQGGIMEYTFDLNNIGTTGVSGDYVINAFVSVNNTLGSSDILVGEVFTGNTGVGTISGVNGAISLPNALNTDYYLILVVDGDFEIAESNEGNNILVSSNKFVISTGSNRANPEVLSNRMKINNIFPNPADRDFIIRMESETNSEFLLQLYDLSGRVVMERNMEMETGIQSFEIDISNLEVGMYQLQIRTDQQVLTERIVKQRK